MAAQDRILCRKCHGDNDRGARFCWYCGAPLRGGARRSRAQEVLLELATRTSKWLLFLAVLAGLVVGAYYALDHYVWPAVEATTTTELAVATTTSTAPTTTTTTLPPRSDRTVTNGADRYATAIAISNLAFPEGAPALVLVPGEDYAQSLSVAPLAAAYEAAVLLVPPEGIRDDLAEEIRRLAPTRVVMVGLPKPNTVTKQLRSVLTEPAVTQVNGDDAYQTAALVAAELKTKIGAVSKVVLVPSDSYIEALAVAPLAAANGWAILLSPRNGSVPRTTKRAIEDLEATSALVVGMSAELALDEVDTQEGADSYETAALVVGYAVNHGSSFTHTAIASGGSFPEGLVAGAYLARDRGILLLAEDGEIPAPLLSVFNANLDEVRVLDFIAMPALAKQMAIDRLTTTTTRGGTSGGASSTTSQPSQNSDTQETTTPSAGGF